LIGLKENSENAIALKECLTRNKDTMVPRKPYFEFLRDWNEVAFKDKMNHDAWTEFHSRRGDPIKVRTLYLRKLLEAYDGRS